VPVLEGATLVKHFEDKKGKGLTLRQGINAALRKEFRENPSTFLWGQDIANKEKEGIFLVTKGMQAEFGDKRVFNGPIAENYILGTANGMSRFDPQIRCVVEGAEFADYFWPAMDQYLECSHDYYRTRGQFTPNVLIRLASGGYIGGGLYHSQTIEGSLANIPGVRIVYPTFADDAYGLVRTAMKSQGPTLFLEPKGLYNDPRTRCQIPEDFEVPFGKARVRKEGEDVVVFTYGNSLMMALKAAEDVEAGARSASEGEADKSGDGRREAGATTRTSNLDSRTSSPSVAVIDLRSIVPLDEDTILTWVQKTGRVVIAHEGPEFGGFGGELAALIAKKGFEYLDAPIQRVGARYSPVPFSTILEAQILPQPEWIKQAILEAAQF
jgi:2-oxoisovalerate dehydrogenase E1 component